MKSLFISLVENLSVVFPFLLSTSSGVKLNKTRVLEAVIMAAIIGGMLFGTFNTKLENMEDTMKEMKQDIRMIRKDLYLPSGQRDAWGYRHSDSKPYPKVYPE